MALALSGGINIWGEFPGETRNQFIDGLTTFLLQAGWQLDTRIAASISATFANPSNGNVTSLAGIAYTYATTLDNTQAYQVKIGATLSDTLTNLVEAVAQGANRGVDYSTPTLPNPLVKAATDGVNLVITFKQTGPTGNGTATSFGPLIGGGYKVLSQSAQTQDSNSSQKSHKAYIHDVQFVDGSSRNFANVKFMTVDESLSSNLKYNQVVSGRRFRVVANRAQFFCYVPGTSSTNIGSVIAGGIPWIPKPTTCDGDVATSPVDQAFWISSDKDIGNPASTPRTSIVSASHVSQVANTDGSVTSGDTFSIFDAAGWTATDALYGTSVVDGANNIGQFHMVAMTPSYNYASEISGVTTLIDSIKWHGNKPMLIEPLVCWAKDNATEPPVIRGQLWDAWIRTSLTPMDTVEKFPDDRYYVAFTNLSKFGTLWLIVPNPEPVQFESLAASWAH